MKNHIIKALNDTASQDYQAFIALIKTLLIKLKQFKTKEEKTFYIDFFYLTHK